jgi:soluble lytic murein transglycosylase-like protein
MGTSDEALKRRRAQFAPIIDAAAVRHRIDPALLRAVAYVESRFNPLALGPPCGANMERARGLVQLMPAVCRELGVTDPHDAAQAAEAGAKLLARHLAHFGGDEVLALAAYNWGRGNVDRLGPYANPATAQLPKQVRTYVGRVLARRVVETPGTPT